MKNQIQHHSLNNKKTDTILLILFSIFFIGFIASPGEKAHRILFFSIAVIPFVIFKFRELYAGNKSKLIFLSSFYLAFLALSMLWSNTYEARIDKAILALLSTYLFITISFYYFSQDSWRKIFDFFVLTSFLVASISTFQFYQDHDFPSARLMNTVHNLHPSITANYFLLSIILVVTKIKKINLSSENLLYVFLMAFFTVGILLTHSRGAMLGFLISGFFIFFLYKKQYALLFIVLSLIAGYLYWLIEPNLVENLFKRGLSYRPEIFATLINRVGDNIFFGLGLLQSEAVPFKEFTAVHSHSIYLASFYHIGLVGLFTHCSILILTIFQGIKIYKLSGEALPLIWMIMGASCLSIDGSIISNPYLMEWLLFWAPVSLTAARYYRLNTLKVG